VAYIGTVETRMPGFEQAFADNDVKLVPDLIWPVIPYNSSENGYNATQAIFASGGLHGPTRITGIVAGSDEVAWGVLRRLHEAGLRVPQDVSVIGMDDNPLDSYLTPALTTIQIPKDEMARLAIQVLLQRKGHTSDPAPITVLPTQLIIRESCQLYR
jgi:LacI family transcriptional regulator